MTLFERGLGGGDVSLAALFNGDGPEPVLESGTSVREALDALIHGGRPGDLDASAAQAQRHLRDYVEDVVNVDVGRLDGEPPSRPDPAAGAAALTGAPYRH
ncbi:hypothetical protein [Actinomyces ruminicola]|uniref:hypothetical protein n=1 Tax=Actinomyces ruminicola TaxID=332524 RepID=UPI001FE06937|nr:hypothetical protein [Actinomyces ruminicola]